MPILQRLRGEAVTIYPTITTTDTRGNSVQGPDKDNPLRITAWLTPDRSSRAEVPGQQQINVYLMGTKANLAGVNLWSRVNWAGKWWDIVSPPAHHTGTRHTQHWSTIIRERPDDGGLNG